MTVSTTNTINDHEVNLHVHEKFHVRRDGMERTEERTHGMKSMQVIIKHAYISKISELRRTVMKGI